MCCRIFEEYYFVEAALELLLLGAFASDFVISMH
jgi:hypothetical protein